MNYYNFAVDEIEKRNLEVKEISSINKDDDAPCYNHNEKKIILGIKKDDEWIIDEMLTFLFSHDVEITEEFKENLILFCILHEIRHVEQYKLLNNTDNNINNEMIRKTLLINNSKTNYYYHDKIYSEFDANMDALLRLSKIKEDLSGFNNYLAYKILYNYLNLEDNKISNPIDNNIEIFDIEKPNTNKNLTKELKFIYGIEMEEEIKRKILDLNNGEIKVKKIIK